MDGKRRERGTYRCARVDDGGVCYVLVREVKMVEVEEGDGSGLENQLKLFIFQGEGKRRTYVITISQCASAYIDIESEILVRSFVFVLGAMALTGLLDHEDRVDVGAEVPGADVGATEGGNLHDLWLGRVEVDLKGETGGELDRHKWGG